MNVPFNQNLGESADFESNLKPQHQAFVHAYLESFNATQSAIKAGFNPTHAKAYGYQLLQRSDIKTEIERFTKMKADYVKVEQFQLVEQLTKIAFADITDYITWNHEEVNFVQDLDYVDGQVVAEVYAHNGKRKIRLHDKLKAIELLGKHLGLFSERINVGGVVTVQIVDDIENLMNTP